MNTAPYRAPWYVRGALLVGLVGGCCVPLYFLVLADGAGLAWDFRAYLAGTRAALAGEPFVGLDAPVGGGEFVYPPVTVLGFVPLALAPGWVVPFVAHGVISLCACLALGRLTVEVVEHRRGPLARFDRRLLYGFFLAGTNTAVVVGLGQVDTLVALAVAGGFVAVERDRGALGGAALGLAAVWKLFPALFGLWLLRRRAWRAVGSAVAVGVGATAVGLALFGVDVHRRYATFLLAERSRVGTFAGGMDPNFFGLTLSRPLSVLAPNLDPALYVPLSAALLAPVLACLYVDCAALERRLAAFLGTVVAVVLVSPASNVTHLVYALVPLVALLYVVDDLAVRGPLAAGVALLGVPFQPAQVGTVLAAAGAPVGLRAVVLDALVPVLTVGSVALYASLLVVVGCIALGVRGGREAPTGRPVRDD